MQTHEWEALLSECADSWELGDAYADGSRLLLEEGSVIGTINMHITHVHEEVAAAAPAAVAEVVRLRREVSAFRDYMNRYAEQYKSLYDLDRNPDLLMDAECYWEIASNLTRILEGGTDE